MTAERWRVVIVEDDPTVSYVHRELIHRSGRFQVVEIVASGEGALTAIGRSKPHLVILDLTLAGMDGISVLRTLRARGSDVEVIAVTASSAPQIVRSVVHLGVVDYLVKPFEPARLQQALGLFLRRLNALKTTDLGQAQIDEVTASGRTAPRWLPKGIAEGPLEHVRSVLAHAQSAVPAEAVAERVGMSRVTARRYLEYLVTAREADVEAHVAGPGRPLKLYTQRASPIPPARAV
jgi:two-component system response regulator DctR